MGIEANDEPQILYPGVISTRFGEYNGTFNPEGTEFFYTLSIYQYDAILHTKMLPDSSWTQPELAPFSANNPEWDPLFSPDGNRLYYSSHRPIKPGAGTDICNIWFSERTSDGWGTPQHVPIHGPRQGNYYSSLTSNGDIYFNIWSTNDLFRAVKVDTGYVVEHLGDVINSDNGDGDPFHCP